MRELEEFFGFLVKLIPHLIDIYDHAQDVIDDPSKADPEKEKQLAMDLIRAAKDAQAKKEIEG